MIHDQLHIMAPPAWLFPLSGGYTGSSPLTAPVTLFVQATLGLRHQARRSVASRPS